MYLEFLDGMRNEFTGTKPDNDEVNENYFPGEDDNNNDDDDDDNDGGGYDKVDPQQETSDINSDDGDDKAIILNPGRPDHDGPIAGVATDQDQTIVNTDTDGKETAYTDATSTA